jgi:hypothetical protein
MYNVTVKTKDDEVIIIGRFYKSQVKEMARQLTNIFTSVRCEVVGE